MIKISSGLVPPCKGCSLRELGCHSKCSEYKEYKDLNEIYLNIKLKEIETFKTFDFKKKASQTRNDKTRIRKKMVEVGKC